MRGIIAIITLLSRAKSAVSVNYGTQEETWKKIENKVKLHAARVRLITPSSFESGGCLPEP